LNREAQANRERRKQKQLQSLELQPPTNEERILIHKMFVDRKKAGGILSDLIIPLSATSRQSTLMMQPQVRKLSLELMFHTAKFSVFDQKRNIHGKIFGGYLMRLALEHGFATAYLFSGVNPVFRAVDELNFIRAVEIGNICTFNASMAAKVEDLLPK